MRVFLLASSILVFAFSLGRAQRTPLGSYTFTVQPLQVLLQEVSGNLEHSFGRNTVGMLAAYRFQTTWDQNTKGPYYNYNRQFSETPYTVSSYHGYTLGFNLKYYLQSHRNVYLEGTVFYRHWWDDNEYHVTYPSRQTVKVRDITNVYGLKLLAGHTSVLSKRGIVRLVLHKYCGLGLRERRNVPYSISNPAYEQYLRYRTIAGVAGTRLSIQLGIAFGFSFYTKAVSTAQ